MMVSQRRRALGLILALGLLLGASIVGFPGLIALVAPATLAVLALNAVARALMRDADDEPLSNHVLRWTMFTFFAHLFFGVVVLNISTPFDFLKSDTGTYHNGAIALLDHWTSGGPAPFFPAGKEGLYFTLAALYWVVGPHAVVGLVLNAALSAAIVPLLSDLTRRQFGSDAAFKVAPLVALLPGLFLWTSQLLKEAPVAFLVAMGAYCAVRVSERASVRTVLGLTLSVSLLFTFRGPIALVVGGGFLAALILAKGDVLGGLTTALLVAALVGGAFFSLGIGLSGYKSSINANLTRANVVRQDLATSARSGFRPDADISTPFRALSYLPAGLTSFALGPFPWQLRSASQFAAIPDVLVWWALLPSLWRGHRVGFGRAGRRAFLTLIPAVLATIMLSLVIGNYGTVVRERVQVVILLIPFIALGLAVRARSQPGPQEDAHALAASRAVGRAPVPVGASRNSV